MPVIVDAAESSPGAAREAALVIRKFLGKDNYMRAYVQYNAIMLVRILADNPGPSFTRNIDSKFISTVKELLRDGRDMSVQQILRETLDTFELQKSNDETLVPLLDMWKSEKKKWAKKSGNDISSGIVRVPALSLFQILTVSRSPEVERLASALLLLRPVSKLTFRLTSHHGIIIIAGSHRHMNWLHESRKRRHQASYSHKLSSLRHHKRCSAMIL